MDIDAAAKVLAELGNPTRLAVLRLLIQAGPTGLAVGDIQSRLTIPGSTLSHHIARLCGVGLIRQERDGRTLMCRPCFPVLNGIVDFLKSECCRGFTEEVQDGNQAGG